jgi:hypothetical protein
VKANVVRIATVVVGLVAVVVAFVDRIPADIPAYAFGDASVLRAERGLALLAILFISFVVLWRGIAEGELPIEISREGFKYQQREVTKETAATVKRLEASVEKQYGSMEQLVNILDRTLWTLESMGDRLARLEARSKEVPPIDISPT